MEQLSLGSLVVIHRRQYTALVTGSLSSLEEGQPFLVLKQGEQEYKYDCCMLPINALILSQV